MIEADCLGMRYPTGRLALDGASLSVMGGELVVILGHNGSGKSTMLRCIAGMLRPTASTVRVAGRDIGRLAGRALAEARMALGMVFQNAHLITTAQRAGECVAAALWGGIARLLQRVWASATPAKLSPAHGLSGRSRLDRTLLASGPARSRADRRSVSAIARALAQRPERAACR